MKDFISCGFCNNKKEITALNPNFVKGKDSNYICEECIKSSYQMFGDLITSEENNSQSNQQVVNSDNKLKEPFKKQNDFKILNTKEIYNKLNEYIVGQEHIKRVLSVEVFKHYSRIISKENDVKFEKSNILLIGDSGTGKTLFAKTLSNILNVPLVITDATSLTQTGYVGENVESILSKLIDKANGDISLAEKGIIFIDEIDKIAKKESLSGRDIAGTGVQNGLLKIIEGSNVKVSDSSEALSIFSRSKNQNINTENILFICGGAFEDLKKLNKEYSIGFSKDQNKKNYNQKEISNEDLIKFGMIKEFIGRIPIKLKLDSITEEMIFDILLKPKNSILKQYINFFSEYKIDLSFENSALKMLSKIAFEQNIGSRGIKSILDKVLSETIFNIDLNNLSHKKIIVDEEFIFKQTNFSNNKIMLS